MKLYFLAPKLTSEFSKVNWQKMSATQIYNLARALTGILEPTCFWKNTPVKLYEMYKSNDEAYTNKIADEFQPGYVEYHKPSTTLIILCSNKSCIGVGKIGVYGKKVMSASDFYNGYLSKVPSKERYFT